MTYAVYQSASNNIGIHTDAEANGTLIGSGTNLASLHVTGLNPATTYYFNVVVADAALNKSAYVALGQATTADLTLPTPGGFTSSTGVTATQFTLNWTAASDDVTPSASLLYLVCSGASASAIDSPAKCEAATQEMAYTANVTSLAITGKSPNTTYYYNVVVKDAAGNPALYEGKAQSTASDSTKPTAGTFLASSGVTATQFTLNWSAASDDVTPAASLLYFVCSGASAAAIDTPAKCEAATQEMAYTANITSLAITGKSPNTTYYYNVVVKDAAGNTALYEGKAQSTASDSTKPTAGTFLASSGVSATQFTLNWSAASDDVTPAASLLYFVCSGASASAIDSPAKCEAATQEMAYTANVTSLAIIGKSPNTTYYYNVVVKDAAGNTTLYEGKAQATASDSTGPTPGNAGTLSASNVTATSLDLSWTKASDDVTSQAALTYAVYQSASNNIGIHTDAEANGTLIGSGTNLASLHVTGLNPATNYYFNVVVADGALNKSAYAALGQATTADLTLPTPGGFTSSTGVTATQFTLNWTAATDDVTPAASLLYFVCSGASASAIDSPAKCEAATQEMAYTANVTSLAITGKSPNTTYYYNVVVKDAAGNPALYEGKAQTTASDSTKPTAGTFLASSGVTATQFTLNWSAASDDVTPAASLLYFVCSGASASAIDSPAKCEAATQEMAYTANITSLAITGKSPNTTYYYNVVVKDAAGNTALYEGKAQSTASDSTKPTAGTFLASSGVSATQFNLNWSAASDDVTPASSLLYFVCSGPSASAIDSPAKCEAATQEMAYTANVTSLAITGKSPNTTYYYNVVVKDAAGNTALYEGKTQSTLSDSTLPIAGMFLASSGVTATQFTLKWSAASDDVTPSASLLYFVCSGASASAIDSPDKCEAATQEMAYTANVTSLAITGKSPNTTYYYNVVVKDAAGNRSPYEGKSQTTTADVTNPTAGTFTASTSVTDSSFTLNWTAATDDVTPQASLLYMVCSGANAAAIDTPAKCEAATQEMPYTANKTSFTLTGKSPSTTYYFNVVVKDAAGNKSHYSGIAQATDVDGTGPVPGNSGNIAASNVALTSLDLAWTAATDNVTPQVAIKYYVYRSATNNIGTVPDAIAFGTLLNAGGTANITSYSVSGLAANTTYYFNVVAEDATANKSIYVTKSQATLPDTTDPTAGGLGVISSANITGSSVDLSWTKATDNYSPQSALSYTLCRASAASSIDTPAKCESAAIYTATDVSSRSVTGLSSATTYYFSLVVADQAGNKAQYTTKAVTTSAGGNSTLIVSEPTVTSGTVYFANAIPSTTKTYQSWTVSNIGSAATTGFTQSLTTGTHFTIDATRSTCVGSQLAAGSSCALVVEFGPSSAGTKTDTLTISASNANPATPYTRNVSGTAATPADYDVTVHGTTPTQVEFTKGGNGDINGGAAVLAVSVTNNSNILTETGITASLSAGCATAPAVTIKTSPGSYPVAQDCGSGGKNGTLGPGQHCFYELSWASGGAQTLASCSITVSGNHLAAKTLTISGVRSDTDTKRNVGPSSYFLGAAAANASGNTYDFTFTSTGNPSATFTNPATTVSLVNFAWNGTTAATDCYTDLATIGGTSSCVSQFQFKPGNVASGMYVETPYITMGSNFYFTLQGYVPRTSSAGPIVLKDGDGNPLSSYNFGYVSAGSSYAKSIAVQVLNSGNQDITDASIDVCVGSTCGATAGPFLVSNDCNGTIGKGATCAVTLTFEPSAAAIYAGGTSAGKYSIKASWSAGAKSTNASISGVGFTTASYLVLTEGANTFDSYSSSPAIAFGNTTDAGATKTINAVNFGYSATTGLTASLSGAKSACFSISGCSAQLSPLASCSYSLSFNPTAGGCGIAELASANAALTVGATNGNSLSIALSGTRQNAAAGDVAWNAMTDVSSATNRVLATARDDVNGYTYLAVWQNNANSDWVLRRLNNSGTIDAGFNVVVDSGYNDQPFAITTDASGNVYAVGFYGTTASRGGIGIRKYTSSGTLAWAKTIVGSIPDASKFSNSDVGHDVLVSYESGTPYVYVGGSIANTAAHGDWYVSKFAASDGTEQSGWPQITAGTAYGSAVYKLTKDASGNIYASGTEGLSQSNSTARAGRIMKYTPSGNVVWAKTDSGTSVETGSAMGLYAVIGTYNSTEYLFETWIFNDTSGYPASWGFYINGYTNKVYRRDAATGNRSTDASGTGCHDFTVSMGTKPFISRIFTYSSGGSDYLYLTGSAKDLVANGFTNQTDAWIRLYKIDGSCTANSGFANMNFDVYNSAAVDTNYILGSAVDANGYIHSAFNYSDPGTSFTFWKAYKIKGP